MLHKLYVDPQFKTHRYQVRVGVNESGVVQADARACCDLDNAGSSVRAKEGDKDGISFTLSDAADAADVAALQALVDAELNGKAMTGKGHIEFWIRDSEIEQGRGTGPWFHYREKVAAAGLVPARQENRNPVLPAATIPYDAIESAAVGAVNAAIA